MQFKMTAKTWGSASERCPDLVFSHVLFVSMVVLVSSGKKAHAKRMSSGKSMNGLKTNAREIVNTQDSGQKQNFEARKHNMLRGTPRAPA